MKQIFTLFALFTVMLGLSSVAVAQGFCDGVVCQDPNAACDPNSGICVVDPCADVFCQVGQYCDAGSCVFESCIEKVVSSLADVESNKTGLWSVSKTCDGSGGNYYMYVSWDDGCTGLCPLPPWIEASVDVKLGTCTATYAPNGAGISQIWDGYTSAEARQLKTDLKAICNEIVDVPACP